MAKDNWSYLGETTLEDTNLEKPSDDRLIILVYLGSIISTGLLRLRSKKIIPFNSQILNHIIKKEIILLKNKKLMIM
jgi:hypothetical protein